MLIQHRLPGSSTEAAHAIRAAVFQTEQGISPTDDYDGLDSTAEQFLALDVGKAIGTARYRLLDNQTAKVERVAVLPDQRGNKVGQAIMGAIEYTAWRQRISTLVLDSQLQRSDFYENIGYQQIGEVFDEVGIPHVKMSLDVRHPSEAEQHYGPFTSPYTFMDIYDPPRPNRSTDPLIRFSGIQF